MPSGETTDTAELGRIGTLVLSQPMNRAIPRTGGARSPEPLKEILHVPVSTVWTTQNGDGCQFRLTTHECQSRLTHMDIDELSEGLSSEDPAIGLRASMALHRLAERVEASNVASARKKGWSWQQVGDALGITRQSVHAKYGRETS